MITCVTNLGQRLKSLVILKFVGHENGRFFLFKNFQVMTYLQLQRRRLGKGSARSAEGQGAP